MFFLCREVHKSVMSLCSLSCLFLGVTLSKWTTACHTVCHEGKELHFSQVCPLILWYFMASVATQQHWSVSYKDRVLPGVSWAGLLSGWMPNAYLIHYLTGRAPEGFHIEWVNEGDEYSVISFPKVELIFCKEATWFLEKLYCQFPHGQTEILGPLIRVIEDWSTH